MLHSCNWSRDLERDGNTYYNAVYLSTLFHDADNQLITGMNSPSFGGVATISGEIHELPPV